MLAAFPRIVDAELDPGLGGQHTQRAAEIDVLPLLDEREEVASFATTAEASPGAAVRENVERGRLFGVERAQPAEAAACLLEWRDAAYELHKVNLALDGVYGVHSLMVAPHRVSR